MKKLILACALLTGAYNFAQTDVNLLIHHTLKGQNTVLQSTETNAQDEDYQITRLQYYITRITVIHDGNQETAISDDTVALINVANELNTTIELGAVNATNLEGVKFHIGVYSPVNNEDPTQWPSGHPLAPQNPSMHWGWASGYRFVAFEGVAGNNFSQIWQFHGLGNGNYYETQAMMAAPVTINGVQTFEITADYNNALNGISISQGLVSHGETGAAQDVLQNFNSDVFYPTATVSTEDVETEEVSVSVFPNPTTDGNIQVKSDSDLKEIQVYNLSGALVQTITVNTKSAQFNLESKGAYILKVLDINGVLSTEKVIY